MASDQSKKTVLKLSKNNQILPIVESGHLHVTTLSGHLRKRLYDRVIGPDGAKITPPPTQSHELKKATTVKRILIDKDAEGEIYITLAED